MVIFTRMKKLRDFERRHLPYLRSIEDFDIVHEIGACQEQGLAMTPKRLVLASIASPATVQRRLSRLADLGVIRKRFSRHDGRIIELTVSGETAAIYAQMASLLRQVPGATPRMKAAIAKPERPAAIA